MINESTQVQELHAMPESLGALIDDKAALLGDKPVCVFFDEGVSLTYRELAEYSSRLAHSLLQIGVRKGTHVAVMIPNLPAFPITWLALAKIGAVIVPVNVSYKSEEFSYVLNDSDTQFLIIDESCLETYRSMSRRPELLTDDRVIVRGAGGESAWHNWDQLCASGSPEFTPPEAVTKSDLCNIQYTSGTTGFPKGCMLSHHYWLLLGHTGSAGSVLRGHSIENILVTNPFFYMGGQSHLMLTLFFNGTAYIARRSSTSRFLGWVRRYKIHYCSFPEIVLKNTPPSPADTDNELCFVNAYLYKSEAHFELERRFNVVGRDSFAMTEIGLGTFVPTEATHMVGSGSCGLAAPFRELQVVNEDGQEVPRGEVGELWVAGPGMFWGYYKKPAANAESFRGKWFRTGDLVYQDDSGYIYVVGRIKEMIKRSGENISAREVEAVLCEHPEILEAGAVPVPDEIRNEEVKAYVILREGLTKEKVTPEQIFAHCAAKLAKFKIPRYLAYVQEFPRTPSNKIAKKQLITASGDLRIGAYDRIDGIWR